LKSICHEIVILQASILTGLERKGCDCFGVSRANFQSQSSGILKKKEGRGSLRETLETDIKSAAKFRSGILKIESDNPKEGSQGFKVPSPIKKFAKKS
jgi:hypothetical protein